MKRFAMLVALVACVVSPCCAKERTDFDLNALAQSAAPPASAGTSVICTITDTSAWVDLMPRVIGGPHSFAPPNLISMSKLTLKNPGKMPIVLRLTGAAIQVGSTPWQRADTVFQLDDGKMKKELTIAAKQSLQTSVRVQTTNPTSKPQGQPIVTAIAFHAGSERIEVSFSTKLNVVN